MREPDCLVGADVVTPAFLARDRARSRAARPSSQQQPIAARQRAAAFLVIAEEGAVGRVASAGLASRWRVVVAFDDGGAV